eukprot:gene29240-35296_t
MIRSILLVFIIIFVVLVIPGGLADSQIDGNNSTSSCPDCVWSTFGHAKRIFYVKTHKTGSSTVTGLLWRELCLRLHFNCFVPPAQQAGRIWNLANAQDRLVIKKSKGSGGKGPMFDAWIHHVRYDLQLPSGIVKAPYLLVSSVRRPAHRFVSAWYWYDLEKATKMSLLSFVRALNRSAEAAAGVHWRYRTGLDATSQELLGVELKGGASDKAAFAGRLNSYLLPLIRSRQIFLVVCDRFDESMLMLRHLLHFHTNHTTVTGSQNHTESVRDTDVWTYLPQKVRPTNESESLDEEQLRVLDAQQPHDLLLYLEANRALDELILAYGPERFAAHLKLYRALLYRVQELCKNHLDASPSVPGVNCAQLTMDNREAIRSYWQTQQARD